MGKSSQLLGKSFELSIERACSNVDGLTLIKVDPHAQRGRAVKSKWLDYIGWVDGRALTFDAKWIGNESRFKRSVLSKIQQQYLDRAQTTGALSFILVGYIAEVLPVQACIPWSDMPARGSVELEPYRVDCWIDWVKEALK